MHIAASKGFVKIMETLCTAHGDGAAASVDVNVVSKASTQKHDKEPSQGGYGGCVTFVLCELVSTAVCAIVLPRYALPSGKREKVPDVSMDTRYRRFLQKLRKELGDPESCYIALLIPHVKRGSESVR